MNSRHLWSLLIPATILLGVDPVQAVGTTKREAVAAAEPLILAQRPPNRLRRDVVFSQDRTVARACDSLSCSRYILLGVGY